MILEHPKSANTITSMYAFVILSYRWSTAEVAALKQSYIQVGNNPTTISALLNNMEYNVSGQVVRSKLNIKEVEIKRKVIIYSFN